MMIEGIEFPDVAALSTRMLTTPRYNPWVYLRLTQEGTGLPQERTYILLLPMDLADEKAVEKQLDVFFAEEGKVSGWLAGLQPTVRVAISHKEAIEGMSTEELVAAMGRPRKWLKDKTGEKEARVAWYPGKEFWMVGDSVSEVRQARTIEHPDTSKQPSAPSKPADPPPAKSAPPSAG